MIFRIVLSAIVLLVSCLTLFAWLTGRQADPGANVGFEVTLDPSTEPAGPLRTPSGRLIAPGTVDDKGYVLPLDVKRPKPSRGLPARPSRAAIDAARSAATTALFTEVRLGPDDGHTQNETSIDAVGGNIVGGFHHFNGSGLQIGWGSSTDGRETWVEGLFSDHSLMSDPVVKAGSAGIWYFAYLAQPGPGGSDIEIYTRRSTDGGATWADPVAASNNTIFDDKPYMDARGDEVLVVWADFGAFPRKIMAAVSSDGAQTFAPAVSVSPNSGGGNGANPVIDDLGNYYVFWRDSFQESLWVSKSTDQGATWSPDRGIVAMDPLATPQPGGFRMVNLPSADAQPGTGNLIVVWNDERFGNADALSIRSTDGGASWSEPVRINDDPGAAAQYFPWVDFDETGVAHVVWYDRRENGFDIDVYVSKSLDAGQTYEPNVRVTAAPFTPILPSEGGAAAFISDYIGIATTSTQVLPFYQDSREGNQDVYVALIPNGATSVASSEAPATAGARIIAAPSPFRRSTTLRVTGGGDLDIIGVDGRMVRRLRAASGTVEWDGRDEAGRVVPRGVYFARPAGQSTGGIRLVKLD